MGGGQSFQGGGESLMPSLRGSKEKGLNLQKDSQPDSMDRFQRYLTEDRL